MKRAALYARVSTADQCPEMQQNDTFVIVRHQALVSTDPRTWKPMYKRLCLLSRLKGHPACRTLPGLGWCYFDGQRFRTDGASVVFKFSDWQSHNAAVDRLKRVPGVRLRVGFNPRPTGEPRTSDWLEELRQVW